MLGVTSVRALNSEKNITCALSKYVQYCIQTGNCHAYPDDQEERYYTYTRQKRVSGNFELNEVCICGLPLKGNVNVRQPKRYSHIVWKTCKKKYFFPVRQFGNKVKCQRKVRNLCDLTSRVIIHCWTASVVSLARAPGRVTVKPILDGHPIVLCILFANDRQPLQRGSLYKR